MLLNRLKEKWAASKANSKAIDPVKRAKALRIVQKFIPILR